MTGTAVFSRRYDMIGGRYRGVGTLPDALLGLAYALGLCVVTTNIVKIYVGRPRPNYSALTALATYGSSTYSDLTVRRIMTHIVVDTTVAEAVQS